MASKSISKIAAFLVRCSTDKQDYQRQVDDLRSVVDKLGFSFHEELIFGEYITGRDDTTKKDRLSIIRCRKAASEKKYNVLLVDEVSRMSRDSVSGRVYVRQFCNLGIPVYFRDKKKWTIDPTTGREDESFIKELGLYFDGAAEYLKSMKTQIASGRRKSLRNNNLVFGHVPFGYTKRGGKDKNHKSELVIDEETAPIVKEIFRMYSEPEATLKSVALATTAKYGVRKTVSGIQQILSRPEYYTGEYTVYVKDPDDKEMKPDAFTITFEPLIEKELFDIAKVKREANKAGKTPYPKQQIHPLSRLIKCPFCGHSFSPRARSGDKPGEKNRIVNGKVALSWICMTRINNAGECDSHINLNDEKLESLVWDFIKKELLDFANLENGNRVERIEQFEEKIAEAKTHISLYEDAISKTEKTVNRAYQAYINAPDEFADEALERYNQSMKDVKKVKDDYIDEIEELKKNIKSWEGSIAYFSQTNITKSYIKKIEKDDVEKRKMFVQLIEKIVPYSIRPGVVVIELFTINGRYYLLLDGNQRGDNRIAHYIAAPFAVWHTEEEGKLKMYEINSYFSLKNTDLLQGGDNFENAEHVSFKEMQSFCTANDWALPYNYIYK